VVHGLRVLLLLAANELKALEELYIPTEAAWCDDLFATEYVDCGGCNGTERTAKIQVYIIESKTQFSFLPFIHFVVQGFA
jgi:hypothetical protein